MADGDEEREGQDQPDHDSGGEPADLESRLDRLETAVGNLVERLGGGGEGGEPDAGSGEGAEEPAAKPRTNASVEADFETKVAHVLGKVRKDEERDRRLEEVEKKTKLLEREPVKQTRRERFMWGARS